MRGAGSGRLRVAVVGGGPAGSFFALYALKYARLAGRDLALTIYEPKDFREPGQAGCNMCAGIVPSQLLRQLAALDLAIPAEVVLGRIGEYSLHTSACAIEASHPDPEAEIISVYRGAGPRIGRSPERIGFDELLLEAAVARGAQLVRGAIRRLASGRPVEVEGERGSEPYDLVVLATGVNAPKLALDGFAYQPPPTGLTCQTELYLGQDEVERRLGSSVHIFLPPDGVASYGILIPKGPYVTASLVHARRQMHSLAEFLAMDEVVAVLGPQPQRVCGCLPKIAVGPARGFVDDGLVAVGDASVTRLYKNGLGSALTTAERAAWTAVHRGCARGDFVRHYLPICRGIHRDNQVGRLLFLAVPGLKRIALIPRAHCRLAAGQRRPDWVHELHARIFWGMFTGAHSYSDLLKMAASPGLALQFVLALGGSLRQGQVKAAITC